MHLKPFGSLTKRQVEKLERKLGVQLPEDYKEFLIKHNGGALIGSDVKKILIKEINELILIDTFFGYELDKNSLNILSKMKLLEDALFENLLIIANDAGHGFITMICSSDNHGIWYWDASRNFVQSTDKKNMYKICDTFTELMELLS